MMNGTFYEQLGGVTGMFEQWGACERTVVACALARRVPWPGLKLLQSAVDAALSQHGNDERLERDANDETYLAGLLASAQHEDDDSGTRLRQLVSLLPLLRADNARAKAVYVCGAAALARSCVATRPRRDLCRQLLAYLLVHPALDDHDHTTLTQWLRYLENHITENTSTENIWQQRIEPTLLGGTNIWSSNSSFRRTIGKNVEFRGIDPLDQNSFNTDFLQESFSKNGRDVDISLEGERLSFDVAISQPKSQRSNSLTPPSTNFLHMSSSAENLSDEPFQKPRSFSLSSEHSLSQIRPISVMYGTTGSETRLDELRSNSGVEYPGMSMVGPWLKNLRLHKYVWLFSNISYEQMMAMDEEYLEKLGVTKGARHKLLLSIRRLSERSATLAALARELAAGGNRATAARALERLRSALLAPMPAASDVPAAIVRVLELAAHCLAEDTTPSDEPTDPAAVDPLSLHCWLVEKALHHESFQRGGAAASLRALRHRLPPRAFFTRLGHLPQRARHAKPRWRSQSNVRRGWTPLPRPKSHSYPPFPPPAQPPRPTPPHPSHPADDYAGLDALCLQMTEQAIN